MNGCIGKLSTQKKQIIDGDQPRVILRLSLKEGLKDLKAGMVCKIDEDGFAEPSDDVVDTILLEDIDDTGNGTSANFLVMGCARKSMCTNASGEALTNALVAAARKNNIYITEV